MQIKIEEAYNDCFERMLSGETLESCLSSYPEYASELYAMLHTTYDIKRRAYPIQPRPEFKYWGRVRLQNAMYYGTPEKADSSPKSISFNVRRNLAISMAALLVFVIASSGTVAASNDAMPDEPLYGVKLAVEQAQVTFTPNEWDKAEIYARMAEKRAQEIAVMAVKGNNEKVVATTQIMNRQLQQLENNLAKMEEENAAENAKVAASVKTATVVTPAVPAVPSTANIPPVPPVPAAQTTQADSPSATSLPPVPPSMAGTVTIKPPSAVTANITRPLDQQDTTNAQQGTSGSGQSNPAAKRAATIAKARETANTSAARSLTILQNAMDKAPESVKPSLNNAINQTITTNKHLQQNTLRNTTIKGNVTGTNADNDNDDDNTNINDKNDKNDAKPTTKPTTRPNIKNRPDGRNTTGNTNVNNLNTDNRK